MTRRFQFSLKALLVVMLAVAIACAIWVRLPVAVKVAIIGAPLSVLVCLARFGLLDALIDGLLPPYGAPPLQDGPKYVIKWRRRGEKTSRE